MYQPPTIKPSISTPGHLGYEFSSTGVQNLLNDLKQSKTARALCICEVDNEKTQHQGFSLTIIGYLERLLSKANGCQLVLALANGEQKVVIRPEGASKKANSETCQPEDWRAAKKKEPTGALVLIDPSIDDTSIIAFDQAYNELQQPPFITLGHELVHALHFTTGTWAGEGQPETHQDYDDPEEEQTIAGEAISENVLRKEHGLPPRFGHRGKDMRFPHLVCFQPPMSLQKLSALANLPTTLLLKDNVPATLETYDMDIAVMMRQARGSLQRFLQQIGDSSKLQIFTSAMLWDRFEVADFQGIDDTLGQHILLAFFQHLLKNQDVAQKMVCEGIAEFPEFQDDLSKTGQTGQVHAILEQKLAHTLVTDAAFRHLLLSSAAFAEKLSFPFEDELRDCIVPLLQKNGHFLLSYILRHGEVYEIILGLGASPIEFLYLADPGEIFCKQLIVQGWFTHYVSQAQIEAGTLLNDLQVKYGVTAPKLREANPSINWQQLKPGTPMLVPPGDK